MVQALDDLRAGRAPEQIVTLALPEELRRRLARSDLQVSGVLAPAPGGSAVVDIAGPALGAARVSQVLHGDGSRVTTALCAAGGRLPPELRAAAAELQTGPFRVREESGPAAERAATALAWVDHEPADIPSDHRWWSEISGLVLLGELMNEG